MGFFDIRKIAEISVIISHVLLHTYAYCFCTK